MSKNAAAKIGAYASKCSSAGVTASACLIPNESDYTNRHVL